MSKANLSKKIGETSDFSSKDNATRLVSITELLQASTDIGSVPPCNNSYTNLLVQAIEAYGKAMGDLTVRELLLMIETTKNKYNGCN